MKPHRDSLWVTCKHHEILQIIHIPSCCPFKRHLGCGEDSSSMCVINEPARSMVHVQWNRLWMWRSIPAFTAVTLILQLKILKEGSRLNNRIATEISSVFYKYNLWLWIASNIAFLLLPMFVVFYKLPNHTRPADFHKTISWLTCIVSLPKPPKR